MDSWLRSALLAILLLVAACTASSGGDTTPASLAQTTTAPPTPTNLSTTTTTTAPTTTTTTTTTATTTTTTTTTTTVPLLDRSDEATIDRLRTDLDVLLANGPRVSGTPSEVAAALYFAEVAADITGALSRLQTVPLPTGATTVNVWAAEVGSGDRLLLIGAHLDSVAGSPGADDNGSGTILVLELLRRLAERPPSSLRVVVVGFGAEERIGNSGHHFGSRFAAGEMEAAGTLPDLMLSVDMVGVGGQLYSVDFRGHDSSFADEVVVAAEGTGVDVKRRSRGEISDHVAFARADVPAAYLLRPDNPTYHTPAEDSVSDEALLDTLEVIEAVLDYLAPMEPDPLRPVDIRPT